MASVGQKYGIENTGPGRYQFNGNVRGLVNAGPGKTIHVSTSNAATGDGRSWSTAYRTMAEALSSSVLDSGDTILVTGKVAEQVSTPAGVFDVSIIGCGTPRHGDAHTGDNGAQASASWVTPSSPTATTPLLIVRQQGWKLINMLFDGPSDAAAVRLFRDAGAGDLEDDASHAEIVGCKFVAGQNHIELHGGLSQVILRDNIFFGATADSILETTGAGVGTNNYFRIEGNHWHDNESHIDVALNFATIRDNTFGKFTTDAVNVIGGTYNSIYRNSFSGTYSISGGYRTGTNDEWGGNYNSLSGGITASDPA
jgi:hypothetical protein